MKKYTIIGSGPCGIIVSIILSMVGNKCIIYDRNTTIGGCHRVDRINGYFSEHGPRIYVNNYLNFMEFLKKLNINFYDLFVPYKYNFPVGIFDALKLMSFTEIFIIGYHYLNFMIRPGYYEKISIGKILKENNFKKEVINYFDKMCKLTDGAGIDKYTAYEFFQLLNQNFFYQIHEPKNPNDKGLWKLIKKKMDELKIKVISNTKIKNINYNKNKKEIDSIITFNNKKIKVDNLILAIPPYNIMKLFSRSSEIVKNSFMDFKKLKSYAMHTNYIPYLTFTMHWNKKVKIKDIWGNGFGKWGVAWINMGDYFKNLEGSLLTCAIIELNTKSDLTNKTANETTSEKELLEEGYRQINKILEVKKPDKLILNPAVKRINDKWITYDTAYMKTIKSFEFPFKSKIKNLFTVGSHNEKSSYAFTSIESSTQNSIEFCNLIDKKTKNIITRIDSLFTINKLVFYIIMIIIIILLYLNKNFLSLTFNKIIS